MKDCGTLKALSKLLQSSKAWQSMAASLLSRSVIDSPNLAQSTAKDSSSGSRTSLALAENDAKSAWNSLKTPTILALRERPIKPPISIFSSLENSITVLKSHSMSDSRFRKESRRVKTADELKVHGGLSSFMPGWCLALSNSYLNSSRIPNHINHHYFLVGD